MKFLVINGPNINMIGIREKNIYGAKSYDDLIKYISETGEKFGIEIGVFQSNHEGEIIDEIQKCYQKIDGIVINAGGYTHTSVAILDALKAVNIKTVEVHLSDISKREEFRKHSYISLVAEKSFAGMGFEGYEKAVEYLVGNL